MTGITLLIFLDSVYPPLHLREPLPAWYIPACLGLAVAPFILPRSSLTIALITPVLLGLCFRLPFYTSGDVASDYYNSGPILALPLWYLDFVLCTSWTGTGSPTFAPLGGESQGYADLQSTWQRLKWSLRLMLPAQRGIGWNWQVKSIPKDPYEAFSTQRRVILHLFWSIFHYAQSAIMLVLLGYLKEVLSMPCTSTIRIFVSMALAWTGAIWVWDRLVCAYSIAAAFCIAVRISDAWEWPPLMGSLSEAWSVRQMWSVVYHQALRRMLSRPAIYVARLLRLPKGSQLSSNTQTLLVFTLSCVYHQLQMYNATRGTTGEFAFFMSQPLAIALEDAVMSLWRKAGPPHKAFTKYFGHCWVLVWFALTLQPYVNGLLATGIVGDWILGQRPLQLGSDLAQMWHT